MYYDILLIYLFAWYQFLHVIKLLNIIKQFLKTALILPYCYSNVQPVK